MKWIGFFILVSASLVGVTLNAERAINHNAVLICGDTPGLEGKGEKNWDGGCLEQRSYDEFWNDTYLMWELMWLNAMFNLHGSAPESDHIHVLYGNGIDYPDMGERYNPEIQMNQPGLHITDYRAYYEDVENIFTWLALGNPGQGIDPMTLGDNLFVWTFDHGATGFSFRVIDVFDPSHPKEIGNARFPYPVHLFKAGLCVSDNYAYFTMMIEGLRIVNVSNPYEPVEVGFYDTEGHAYDCYKQGNLVIVADGTGGINIIDVTDVTSPERIGYYDTPGLATGIYGNGNLIFVADANAGLRVINIEDPTTPYEEWFYTGIMAKDVYAVIPKIYLTGIENGIYKLFIFDISGIRQGDCVINTQGIQIEIHYPYAYIVGGFQRGIEIVNVSQANNPYVVGHLPFPYGTTTQGLSIYNSIAYVANAQDGLRVIDVFDPANPSPMNHFGYPQETNNFFTGICASGNYVYVAARVLIFLLISA